MARNLVAQDGKGETLDLSEAKNFGFFCAKNWLLFHASLLFHVRKIYFTVGKSLAFFQFDHLHFHKVVGYYQSQIMNQLIVGGRISGESINESFDLIISDALDRVEVSKGIRPEKRKDILEMLPNRIRIKYVTRRSMINEVEFRYKPPL